MGPTRVVVDVHGLAGHGGQRLSEEGAGAQLAASPRRDGLQQRGAMWQSISTTYPSAALRAWPAVRAHAQQALTAAARAAAATRHECMHAHPPVPPPAPLPPHLDVRLVQHALGRQLLLVHSVSRGGGVQSLVDQLHQLVACGARRGGEGMRLARIRPLARDAEAASPHRLANASCLHAQTPGWRALGPFKGRPLARAREPASPCHLSPCGKGTDWRAHLRPGCAAGCGSRAPCCCPTLRGGRL